MDTSFQRARSPGQKAERSAQILAAAEAMLDETLDAHGLSLNELARRAGMAKSNVYRYFESREGVLLALLEASTERWAEAVVSDLGDLGEGAVADRIEKVIATLARLTAARPLMCHLMSVLPSVLEHNLSVETVRAYKLDSLSLLTRLALAMHQTVPELEPEQHGELLHHAFALIVGIWPLAHPSEVAAEVMEDPRLEAFRHDFEADLRRAMILMARGMLAG